MTGVLASFDAVVEPVEKAFPHRAVEPVQLLFGDVADFNRPGQVPASDPSTICPLLSRPAPAWPTPGLRYPPGSGSPPHAPPRCGCFALPWPAGRSALPALFRGV